ncbi:hypothetical protein C8F04DRAFT_925178, partial [Mycena alexandri]
MFVPFFSTRRRDTSELPPLARRKGGGASSGGKGSSSSSVGKSSSSSGKSSSSSSKDGTPIKSAPITVTGTSKSSSTYGGGGGKVVAVPKGQVFAGRMQGGGTRAQIYGTQTYGSGYPSNYGRGVSGRPFPFYFWPVVWGSGVGVGSSAAYMYGDEYGEPSNNSRPGGPMSMAAFQSNSTGTTFRLIADNTTVADLMPVLTTNCSSHLVAASSNTTTPFNASDAEPEQTVQYYRASSVALTLDGYNNTADFAAQNSTADTPLPTGIDTDLLNCLNATIGQAVPLIDGARATISAPSLSVVALVFLI